mmetsp:Transcript_9245/g.23673  ORF Transcript_9245/g.23673 Transcript_9245/m.23673 type:complete len:333 (-) Transcript_9245:135-1133(-)
MATARCWSSRATVCTTLRRDRIRRRQRRRWHVAVADRRPARVCGHRRGRAALCRRTDDRPHAVRAARVARPPFDRACARAARADGLLRRDAVWRAAQPLPVRHAERRFGSARLARLARVAKPRDRVRRDHARPRADERADGGGSADPVLLRRAAAGAARPAGVAPRGDLLHGARHPPVRGGGAVRDAGRVAQELARRDGERPREARASQGAGGGGARRAGRAGRAGGGRQGDDPRAARRGRRQLWGRFRRGDGLRRREDAQERPREEQALDGRRDAQVETAARGGEAVEASGGGAAGMRGLCPGRRGCVGGGGVVVSREGEGIVGRAPWMRG